MQPRSMKRALNGYKAANSTVLYLTFSNKQWFDVFFKSGRPLRGICWTSNVSSAEWRTHEESSRVEAYETKLRQHIGKTTQVHLKHMELTCPAGLGPQHGINLTETETLSLNLVLQKINTKTISKHWKPSNILQVTKVPIQTK